MITAQSHNFYRPKTQTPMPEEHKIFRPQFLCLHFNRAPGCGTTKEQCRLRIWGEVWLERAFKSNPTLRKDSSRRRCAHSYIRGVTVNTCFTLSVLWFGNTSLQPTPTLQPAWRYQVQRCSLIAKLINAIWNLCQSPLNLPRPVVRTRMYGHKWMTEVLILAGSFILS